MPHERLSAHQAHLHRVVPSHDFENAIHQRVALPIADFTKVQAAAQMVVAVSVTSRTLQRALARDLYGK